MPAMNDPLVDNIDAFLATLEVAQNDDELRLLFKQFDEVYDLNVPEDPFSEQYREAQFSLYERIAGKSYNPSNEVSAFNVEEMASRPFPYCHASSSLVGDQLMAIGFIIKTMGLSPGARILEFGPGWGNTTIALAKMGYDVTAVDIEQNFVDLILRRAAMENLSIDAILGDFSLIETINKKFDAVLFFECFHHSQNHIKIIENLDRVLDDNGVVCFAAEPINQEFPLPWGLRMDGQSVWAIRNFGWLELGFNTNYFVEALNKFNFLCSRHKGFDSHLSNILLASRSEEFYFKREHFEFSFAEKSLFSQCGTVANGKLSVSNGDSGVACFGPYKELDFGDWEVLLDFEKQDFPSGPINFDVVHQGGRQQLVPVSTFGLDENYHCHRVGFSIDAPVTDLEVRIHSDGNSKFVFNKMLINRSPMKVT